SEVTNTAPGSGTTGWFGASDVPSLGSQVTITANHFDCSLRLRRGTGGVIAVDGNGLIAGGPIDVFTIGASWPKPARIRPIAFFYRTTTGGVRAGMGRVTPEGIVQLISGQPNQAIQQYTTPGEDSVNIELAYPIA